MYPGSRPQLSRFIVARGDAVYLDEEFISVSRLTVQRYNYVSRGGEERNVRESRTNAIEILLRNVQLGYFFLGLNFFFLFKMLIQLEF